MLIATQCPRLDNVTTSCAETLQASVGRTELLTNEDVKFLYKWEMNFACRLTLEESEESSTPSL